MKTISLHFPSSLDLSKEIIDTKQKSEKNISKIIKESVIIEEQKYITESEYRQIEPDSKIDEEKNDILIDFVEDKTLESEFNEQFILEDDGFLPFPEIYKNYLEFKPSNTHLSEEHFRKCFPHKGKIIDEEEYFGIKFLISTDRWIFEITGFHLDSFIIENDRLSINSDRFKNFSKFESERLIKKLPQYFEILERVFEITLDEKDKVDIEFFEGMIFPMLKESNLKFEKTTTMLKLAHLYIDYRAGFRFNEKPGSNIVGVKLKHRIKIEKVIITMEYLRQLLLHYLQLQKLNHKRVRDDIAPIDISEDFVKRIQKRVDLICESYYTIDPSKYPEYITKTKLTSFRVKSYHWTDWCVSNKYVPEYEAILTILALKMDIEWREDNKIYFYLFTNLIGCWESFFPASENSSQIRLKSSWK
jgi:hypothetical protein